MIEPAELLLIKDQNALAFHSLSRGLSAEEAGQRAEALEYYRKCQQHLTQGVEVPTSGERQKGAVWDTARQLQQKMRDVLGTLSIYLSDIETSQLTPEKRREQLLKDISPNLYPTLGFNSQPPHSPLHHLYPTIPDTSSLDTALTTNTAPARPASPAAVSTLELPAATPETTVMANPGDQPPAYTPQPTSGHRSLSYGPEGSRSGKQMVGENGSELLFIPTGAQMFFVAQNGQVSSLSHPGYLRIIAFECQQRDAPAGRPPAFLDVCGWVYPLAADTPVLLANSGIFMFPDTLAETPGSYVGIVLSSELPAVDREMFQDLMLQLTDFRVQGPDGAGADAISLSEKVPLGPPIDHTGLLVVTGKKEKAPLPTWSEKMGQGILTGATRLSQGVIKGAEATGRAIQKGASKIRDHMTPEETPSEVSPRVTKGLQVAKQATGGAVRVSQYLVNGVSTVVGHVAEKVAPHVKKHGAKLIPESMKTRKDGQPSNLDGAKFVACSSVQGFSTVWSSLETGAKLVGKSVASETVTTVKHKYGDDAGQATDTGLQSVINVGVTAFNIDNLGIKAILKSAGKKTAKAMLKSSEDQSEESEEKKAKKQENQEETVEMEVQKKQEDKKT
ncbi:spartin a isoform 2-T2 [Aulostomus maculatus]